MSKQTDKAIVENKEALSVLVIPIGLIFGTGVGLVISNLALGIIGGVTVGCILFGIFRAKTSRK